VAEIRITQASQDALRAPATPEGKEALKCSSGYRDSVLGNAPELLESLDTEEGWRHWRGMAGHRGAFCFGGEQVGCNCCQTEGPDDRGGDPAK
jgi:hypothetical protein